jgi:molecular chaperone DnaK
VVRFDANNQEEKYVFNMLDRHARLPVEHIETGFGTLYANQTGIDIELMEQADGNSDFSESLEHNIKIGEGKISGLPAGLPAGSPVHITFRLEEDGRLSVYVVEPNSGKECTIVTQIEGVLSEEEVRDRATALQQIHTS